MDQVTATLELLRLLAKEGRRRILPLSLAFSVIALAGLGLGAIVPKQYEAYSILLAESKNIIAPLMAGRAVQSGVADEAHIVRAAFLSRRVLREILAYGGWGEFKDPVEEARELDRLSRRIIIQSPRRELIRIGYKDTDPRRCFDIANKLAEIYIRESTVGKERESRDAFDFIDKQVKEYATKVEDAHSKVLAYQRGERPDGKRAAPIPRSGANLRRSADQLASLTVEESTLAAELASSEARLARQRRAERVAQLERELEGMLSTLTENHPNVQRVREELRVQRAEAERAAAAEEASTKSLRSRLEKVRSQITSISGSALPVLGGLPALDVDPELRGVGHDSALSELIRRYEAARQVYQDLLVRRENARVSMELEAEHGGVAVRVYEPAEFPVVATGLRLMHFSLIGMVLGTLAPLGALFALVRLDPRIRSARQLELIAHVPLLAGIPHAATPADRARDRRNVRLSAVLITLVFAIFVAFFVIRKYVS